MVSYKALNTSTVTLNQSYYLIIDMKYLLTFNNLLPFNFLPIVFS